MKKNATLLLLFLLFGCSPKNNTVINFSPTFFKIESIEALNLSEDMSTLSSMQDEILCKICIVEMKDTLYEIMEEFEIPMMNFNSKMKTHSISKSYNLKLGKPEFAVFSLIELDNENSEESIHKIINKKIEEGIFLSLKSPLQIDSLIGDDDFLGMKYIDFSKLKKEGKQAMKISGRQLFDKFDYRIYYHFE